MSLVNNDRTEWRRKHRKETRSEKKPPLERTKKELPLQHSFSFPFHSSFLFL